MARRTAFLVGSAVVVALALSGVVAFRRTAAPRRTSSPSPMPGPSFFAPSSAPAAPPTVSAAAALDAQYIDNKGKKASLLQAKKPAKGTGSDGIANRTRGAGTGTGLGLDG